MTAQFLAIDLGAESGRVMLGRLFGLASDAVEYQTTIVNRAATALSVEWDG